MLYAYPPDDLNLYGIRGKPRPAAKPSPKLKPAGGAPAPSGSEPPGGCHRAEPDSVS